MVVSLVWGINWYVVLFGPKANVTPLVRGPFTVCVILSSYLIYGVPVGSGK
jgi:hypothetical protein